MPARPPEQTRYADPVPPSIAILLHELDTDARSRRYRLWSIVQNWRDLGCDVRLVNGTGPDARKAVLAADILLPHLDCSVIAGDYAQLIDEHPRAINTRIRDIRKRAFSPIIVGGPDDPYQGPVIVKTNNNSGGSRDVEYSCTNPNSPIERFNKWLAWHPRVLPHCLGWTRTLPRYPIFDSPRQVPRAAWRNKHVVVERFLTSDRDDQGRHLLHMWIVMGNASVGRTLASKDPYVKDRHAELGSFDNPPPEVVELRDHVGLDYGKIDFIIADGTPHVIDINWTPTLSGDPADPFYLEQCRPLAEAGLRIGSEPRA